MSTEFMDAFASVEHSDENFDLPPLREGMSKIELLDYMVLSVTRTLSVQKAFKGGYMLNKLIKASSRQTSDIDFSISSKEDYEEIKHVLKSIAEKFICYGYISSYKIKETIEEKMSGGIDLYNDTGEKVLGVDVGLHDIGWGVTSYSFDVTTLDGFEIERMLADKLIAITSRKRFRRTKDLYDFFIITSSFDFSFDKLKEYVALRGGAEWENIPFTDVVIREYEKAWNKLRLIDINGNNLDPIEFSKAVMRFYVIAVPCKENKPLHHWNRLTQRLE